MTNITKVGIAGDWHGNTMWAESAIVQMTNRLLLAGEKNKVILQLGDFGYWREDDKFIITVSKECLFNDVKLYFVDGNHENHPLLADLGNNTSSKFVEVAPNVYWIRRGARWDWHGRVWLACGGAVSVDQNHRREGFDWFPEEEITYEQMQKIVGDGKADVMLTHDCPAYHEPYDPTNPYGFRWDLLDLSRSHAVLLQNIVDGVEAKYLYHGHYHTAYEKTVARPYGDIKLTGLHCDGSQYNWGILDIETMEFAL